jgi:hypothetical protein
MQKSFVGLILATAAAFGYQKYSKMTPEQKADLKKRGKGFLDKNFPGMKNMFGKKETTTEPEFTGPPY